MEDLSRLSVNQHTLKQWDIPELLQGCASEDVPFVALWREKVAETGCKETAHLLQDAGLRVSSLCRGGFFPAGNSEQRSKNRAENRRAVDEAAALGTETLVLVCGGMVNRDLDWSRRLVEEGISDLLPYATAAGVRLGVEPLHPMFAADRSVIVSLRQANRIVESFNHPDLGVVIDVYHVWWDPDVEAEVARAAGRIFGFHVNDWIAPLPDVLNGRGMMGDGVIDIRRLRQAVDRTGYRGPIEVEIFNEKLWQAPGTDSLRLIKERYLRFV